MNRAIAASSSLESLKSGTASVTISSQKPSSRMSAMESRLAEASPEIAVTAVVEALQVHFVQVQPWPKIAQHSGVAFPLETKPVSKPAWRARRRICPLGCDQAFVIGADD